MMTHALSMPSIKSKVSPSPAAFGNPSFHDTINRGESVFGHNNEKLSVSKFSILITDGIIHFLLGGKEPREYLQQCLLI